MQQARYNAVLFFQRIGGETRGGNKLFLCGKYLTKKRIVWVAFFSIRAINARGTRSAKRRFASRPANRFASVSRSKRCNSSSGLVTTSASCVIQSSLDGVFRVTICAILWLSYQVKQFQRALWRLTIATIFRAGLKNHDGWRTVCG